MTRALASEQIGLDIVHASIRKIVPSRILLKNHRNFLGTRFPLNLLFQGDCIVHRVKKLKKYEFCRMVFGTESLSATYLVLRNSQFNIRCHPGVKNRMSCVRHDVNVSTLFHFGLLPIGIAQAPRIFHRFDGKKKLKTGFFGYASE
jgi:hypothetical protein